MCKELKSGTARWNLAVGLLSNRNIAQSWRVSVPRQGSGAHTQATSCTCSMHSEFIIPMGMHLGASQVWGHISTSTLEKQWQSRGSPGASPAPHLWAGMPFKKQPDEAKVHVHFLQYSPKPRADFLGFIPDFKWLFKKKKKERKAHRGGDCVL